jgi:hypothetical protein
MWFLVHIDRALSRVSDSLSIGCIQIGTDTANASIATLSVSFSVAAFQIRADTGKCVDPLWRLSVVQWLSRGTGLGARGFTRPVSAAAFNTELVGLHIEAFHRGLDTCCEQRSGKAESTVYSLGGIQSPQC